MADPATDQPDRSDSAEYPASSVTDFRWPAASDAAELADQNTRELPGAPTLASATSNDHSANPIRGPPTVVSATNNVFSSDFLNLGASLPGDTESSAPHQLVVIDPRLDDVSVLVGSLTGPGVDLLILADAADPLAQVQAALDQSRPVSAIHIFSHGSVGQFTLGDLTIDHNLLLARADELERWAELLSDDASLLVYGCNLAGSAAGRSLVDRLAELTGATVAASTDLTGNPLLGGDWNLEYQAGRSEAVGSFSVPAYPGLAFKPQTHIEVAKDVRTDLMIDDQLDINGGKYDVHPRLLDAIRQYPSFYYAGTVGPDGTPDLVFGQSILHPVDTGVWLQRLFDQAWAAQTDPAFARI